MITIENLNCLKEEVLVSELKQDSKKSDPFTDSNMPASKNDYTLYEVVKVGKKQLEVKVGDKVIIAGQRPQEIVIKGQGVLDNIFSLRNSEEIFAVYVDFKE